MSALNDLAVNGVIPPGDYPVPAEGFTVSGNVRGSGKGVTRLVLPAEFPNFYDGVIRANNVHAWSVRDLTIDMGGLKGSGISTFQSNGWTVDVDIEDILLYGVFANAGLGWKVSGTFAKKNPSGTYQNCAIIASSSGGELGEFEISGVKCYGTGMLLSGHDSYIGDNLVIDNAYGAHITTNMDTARLTLDNNRCFSGRGLDVNTTWVEGFEIWGNDHIVTGNIAGDNEGPGFGIWAQRTRMLGNLGFGNERRLDKGADFHVGWLDNVHNGNDSQLIGNKGSCTVDPSVTGLIQSDNSWQDVDTGSTVTVPWTVGTLAVGDTATVTAVVPGAKYADRVAVTISTNLRRCNLWGYVDSPGRVRVMLANNTKGLVNLGALTTYVTVARKG